MSHRIRTTLAAVLLALGVPGVTAARADASQYPNLAPTPPMGWNNWSFYQCGVNEDIILGNARALVGTGLAAKGYDTVTIDDCWMSRRRDASGDLVPDPAKFPDGMAQVGERLHALGLKFGIYADAGTATCEGYPGSMDHFQADADLFARWKVDYLKLDGCNVPVPSGRTKEQAYHAAYARMSRALVNTGRPIVFSVSAPAYFQFDGDAVWHRVIGWSGQVGNLWREGADIALERNPAAAKWSSILFNYSYNAKLAGLQRPGRWNDPDFLLAGDSGLSTDEIRSQVLLWATMAAPLISSTDLTTISPAALAVLGDRDVIAVDQDLLGLQGRIVQANVLAKPLANGDRAVALFNPSDEARTLTTTATAAGLPPAPSYVMKDLVTKQITQTAGTISVSLRPHATTLLRVHPGLHACC